jgi:uracil-DNA glycosylase
MERTGAEGSREVVRPDARKRLETLRAEWKNCTACELGVRRQTYDGEFVFGEGVRRGIMFIGEGPGEKEELSGQPFVGPSGRLLRHILKRLGVTDAYITNLVTCRSCAQAQTADGEPIFTTPRRSGVPVPRWQDQPPSPAHFRACMNRLHQEIYLVDPRVVVTLGATAAEALLGKKVAITQKRGEPERLAIPGASYQAVLTEKRHAWLRKQDGQWVAPTEQNQVYYYCIPTIHPAWVLRKLGDLHPDESAFRKLVEDIRLAAKVYEEFMMRVFEKTPDGASDTSVEAVRAGMDPEDDE